MSGRPIGWERLEAEWWATIRETIAKPWPREAVLMDLRYWQGQEAASGGRVERPGRPTLIALWGWTDWHVKQAFKSEGEWSDPRRQRTASAPPEDRQRTASEPPAEDKGNADNMEETASEPPVNRQPTASEPPADRPARVPLHGTQITDHEHESPERILVPPVPEPPVCAPPQAIPTSAPVSTAKDATNTAPALFNLGSVDTAEPPKASAPKGKKTKSKADNSEAIAKVWTQYRIHKPLCEVEPTKEAIDAIGPALSRATPEKLILLIRWAFDCNDEKGQHLWLQGKARGSERKYQGIGNLMVVSKVAERLEEAIPWAEREAKGPAFGGHPTPEGVVFGRVEPKQAKPSALPPNFQKQQKVCGIDAAADMWDYAQELKTNNQQQSEAM